MSVLEPGLLVTGHRVTGSTILAGSGRVGSQISVTDPMSDPVFLDFFERVLLLLLGREIEHPTLESVRLR